MGEVAGKNLFKRVFYFFEKIGFHILPMNYEDPIPDTRKLKEEIWQNQSELIGIDINEQKQIELLENFSTKYKQEYDKFPKNRTDTPSQYYVNNRYFGSVDGEILYCIIRNSKPKKIIEIGSGNSTYLSAQAIMKNLDEDNYQCTLTSIEPYPNETLKAGFPGLSKLINKQAQEVPLSEFQSLQENDILFIDSSHILKIGSDVQYELLEIIPRLNKGVIIHIHDIFMPAEYPKYLSQDLRFLNEQYLLQAFLAFNKTFEVMWAGSYMHLKHPSKLEAAFSSYNRTQIWPGSFWIKKNQ